MNVYIVSLVDVSVSLSCALPRHSAREQAYYYYEGFQVRPGTNELYCIRVKAPDESFSTFEEGALVRFHLGQNEEGAKLDLPAVSIPLSSFRWNSTGTLLACAGSEEGFWLFDQDLSMLKEYDSSSVIALEAFPENLLVFRATPRDRRFEVLPEAPVYLTPYTLLVE